MIRSLNVTDKARVFIRIDCLPPIWAWETEIMTCLGNDLLAQTQSTQIRHMIKKCSTNHLQVAIWSFTLLISLCAHCTFVE